MNMGKQIINSPLSGRTPPNNEEAEMCVLGALFLDPKIIHKISVRLLPEDFYHKRNAKIYAAIRTMSTKEIPCDIVTCATFLKEQGELETIGGNTYLAQLVNFVPTSANIETYADIVREKSNLRKIISACEGIRVMAYQGEYKQIPIAIQKNLMSVVLSNGFKTHLSKMGDVIKANYEELMALINGTILKESILTGYYDLDEITGGLHKGEMILLAARPSMGKTALALDIIFNIVKQNIPTLFFSVEMSKQSISDRAIASQKKINLQLIRKALLNPQQMSDIKTFAEEFSKQPLFIDDSAGLQIIDLMIRSKKYKHEHDIKFIVLDHIHIMRGFRGETDEQKISNISRTIKQIAKELDVPILALAQLNRQCETRHNRRPQMSDLRGSGSLEQDADVCLFLYRDAYYNKKSDNTSELIIAKQRNGPTGIVKLFFDPSLVSFENYYNKPYTSNVAYEEHWANKEPEEAGKLL